MGGRCYGFILSVRYLPNKSSFKTIVAVRGGLESRRLSPCHARACLRTRAHHSEFSSEVDADGDILQVPCSTSMGGKK